MRKFASALAIVILATAGSAAAAPPITKIEARQMSVEKTKRRILDQLGDILIEGPRPDSRRRPPTRPLQDLSFTTRPRSTYLRGLCAYEEVRIAFQPTTDQDLGAETPVRASGLEASTRYGLLRDPVAIEDDETPPRAADERACRDLPRDRYFEAEDEQAAIESAIRLRLAAQAAGTRMIPVTCDGAQPVSDEACRNRVAGFQLTGVFRVDVQYLRRDERGADTCWVYAVSGSDGEYELRVYGRFGVREVLRVEASEQIVLAHERVD
jgi:hypothetical protein